MIKRKTAKTAGKKRAKKVSTLRNPRKKVSIRTLRGSRRNPEEDRDPWWMENINLAYEHMVSVVRDESASQEDLTEARTIAEKIKGVLTDFCGVTGYWGAYVDIDGDPDNLRGLPDEDGHFFQYEEDPHILKANKDIIDHYVELALARRNPRIRKASPKCRTISVRRRVCY